MPPVRRFIPDDEHCRTDIHMEKNGSSVITPSMRRHLPWRFLLVLLIPVLYGLAFKDVAIRDIPAALKAWDVTDIMLLVLVNAFIISAMCLRLRLILHRCGYGVSMGRLALYRIAANAVSMITPGPHFGGEPLQIRMLIRRHRLPIAYAAASVTTDRAIEMLANLGLLCIGGFYLYHAYGLDTGLQIQPVAVPLLIFATACLYLKILADGRAPLSYLIRNLYRFLNLEASLSSWATLLESAEKKAGEILKQPLPILWLYGGCAVIQWFLMAAEFWLIYAVIGMVLKPSELIAVVVAARIVFLLPLPGALGVLEASQVLILGCLSLSPGAGLVACLIMRARDLVMVSAGVSLVCFWLWAGWPSKNTRRRLVSGQGEEQSRDGG